VGWWVADIGVGDVLLDFGFALGGNSATLVFVLLSSHGFWQLMETLVLFFIAQALMWTSRFSILFLISTLFSQHSTWSALCQPSLFFFNPTLAIVYARLIFPSRRNAEPKPNKLRINVCAS